MRLSNRKGIRRLVGEKEPIIEAAIPATVASAPSVEEAVTEPTGLVPPPTFAVHTQPSNNFQYPSKPLKGGTKAIMQTMVELFWAQLFMSASAVQNCGSPLLTVLHDGHNA